MKRKEKVEYLRIALAIQNIGVNNEICDRIIETYEKVLELKGGFTIQDAVNIESKMDKIYSEK